MTQLQKQDDQGVLGAMANVAEVVEKQSGAWDALAAEHPQAHLLQTHVWAALKSEVGWRHQQVMLQPAGKPAAGASILFRQAAGLTVAYVPKGPLTDWEDEALTGALLAEIEAVCRRHGASVLKVEPEAPDTHAWQARLRAYGFVPSRQHVQPRSTIRLNIQGSDDDVLQRMKSKWRYNVRLATRKGVVVRVATAADLPAINAMMEETGTRDGFAVHAGHYYATAYRLLVPQNAVFLLAEFAGKPLAAIVVAAVGRSAWYLWGASSNLERNRMPNHLLQWAGMQWARARGAEWYDFWGIPDEIGKLAVGINRGSAAQVEAETLPVNLDELPSHDLWGVYRFKQGFGGEVMRYVGAWDKPIGSIGYRVYATGLWARAAVHDLQQRVQAFKRWTGPADGVEAVREAATWRQKLATLPSPHVLQSWEWGELKSRHGWQAERYVVSTGSGAQPSGAFQLLWRQPLPYVPVRIGYVSKGPVVDWTDLAAAGQVLAAVEQTARARGCFFVKMDPDVQEESPEGVWLLATLRRRGWRYSQDQIQFKNSGYSDLTVGETALLEGMKSKWRYNVRLAERRGITVREGTPADFPAFYHLYAETGQRDGFIIRPYEYYSATWASFLQAEGEAGNPAGGVLLLAEQSEESEPLAGIFLMRYDARTWYFYGASSERRRRDMPNYLLQWAALRWAVTHGCTLYDWWGAPQNPTDPADDMHGVWQFKQGFGAEFRLHVGAWDYPVSPWLYRLYTEVAPSFVKLLQRLHRRRYRTI